MKFYERAIYGAIALIALAVAGAAWVALIRYVANGACS